MPYHMGYAGGLGWLIGLLFLVGLVLVIVWLVTTLVRADRSSRGDGFDRGDRPVARDPSRPTPTEILRERFARGEITEEQLEQMRKVLGPDR